MKRSKVFFVSHFTSLASPSFGPSRCLLSCFRHLVAFHTQAWASFILVSRLHVLDTMDCILHRASCQFNPSSHSPASRSRSVALRRRRTLPTRLAHCTLGPAYLAITLLFWTFSHLTIRHITLILQDAPKEVVQASRSHRGGLQHWQYRPFQDQGLS